LSSSKGTRWKDTSPGKLRIFQKGQIARGTKRNQVLEPSPPIVISILDRERGGTLRKILDLDQPSPIITIPLPNITNLYASWVYSKSM